MREQSTALEHMYFFLAFVEQYAKEIGDERRPFSTETWEDAFKSWERQQASGFIVESDAAGVSL